jgi:hypothetical protein
MLGQVPPPICIAVAGRWNCFSSEKTQIWIAISVYVFVAIVKKSLNLDRSLYTILQILSVTIFEKMPIEQVLSNIKDKDHEYQVSNQQYLFNEHGDSSDLSKW